MIFIDKNAHCPVCSGAFRLIGRLAGGRSVIVCKKCGLRRLWPLPSPAEISRLYGRKEYYTEDLAELHDDLVVGYAAEAPIIRLYRRHLEAITAAAPPPGRLLEVGCARGVFLDMARRAGYEVVGVEMNRYAADYARVHFGLDVAEAEFETYESAATFDVVVALDVLEHALDPAVFMRRLAGLLKPGGLAAIGTPDSSSFLYRLAENLCRSSGGLIGYPLFRFFGRGVEHLSIFDPDNLGMLADRVGLRALSTYGYSIPLPNMSGLRGFYRLGLKLLGRRPYEFMMLARKKPPSSALL